ncbi:PIG-L deacetylase family protein [Gryllotalpicola reticulitermitis]|uniref:PIG-L deacetylase family protein n=1 Tax=Gryllotalpicola reticulitermitis TaxID=1184153 RepID=A0ABV8Q8M7_9MICO
MSPFVLPHGPISVLAIGAHPDDIEIGCGGTLLTLGARDGTSIHTLILSGTPERRIEAQEAARAFGTAEPPVIHDFPDTRLPAHWDTVKDALHAFQKEHPAPDVIFVPRPDDAHQDHRLLGTVVPTVWRGPTVLHYEIPKWDGDVGRPNVYLPLDPEIAARKVALLNQSFPSQHAHHWWDDEFFLGLMRLRGVEAITKYAEAFTTAKLTIEFGAS